MGLRPITGWAYAGTGDVTRWTSLDQRFCARLESVQPIHGALRQARLRWGLSRLACLTAGASAEPSQSVGFCYAKLGPHADTGVLRSAWTLLERGAADAVWVRAQGAEFVIERTGDAPVGLSAGTRVSPELVVDATDDCLVTAVVAAAAIVELGGGCGPGGVEPEIVTIREMHEVWQLEVRG